MITTVTVTLRQPVAGVGFLYSLVRNLYVGGPINL